MEKNIATMQAALKRNGIARVVNEYDLIYGTRKDRVEVVWPITGRGHSQ